MANNKEKEPKNKKRFFKDFKAELKKVIWPTPKQLVNNTAAVVVIVIITAAIVFALDFAFELLNKYGINKVKAVYKNNTVIEQNIGNIENVQLPENNATAENSTNSVIENINNELNDASNNIVSNINE